MTANLRKTGADVAPHTPAADAAENVPAPADAAPAWPEGFNPPPDYYEAGEAAHVAAFVAKLAAGFDPTAFNAPSRPVLAGGTYIETIAAAMGGEEAEDGAADDDALGLLAGLYASGPFLRFMHVYGVASAYVTAAPALEYRQRSPTDVHRTGSGPLAEHKCELSGVTFYVPQGAPVPVLCAVRVGKTADGEPDGLPRTWGYTVHPALVDAGPAAVARALLHAVRNRMETIAEDFGEVVDLAAMVAATPPGGPGAAWPSDPYRDSRYERTPSGGTEVVEFPAGYYTSLGKG